jgi:hypothetical protein
MPSLQLPGARLAFLRRGHPPKVSTIKYAAISTGLTFAQPARKARCDQADILAIPEETIMDCYLLAGYPDGA